MGFDFNSNEPIYLQIIEHIKTEIISGKYKPGDKIPTVRELSLLFEVNPNTVQKALSELEDIGLIYTESTNGKFVTTAESVITMVKEQTILNMVNEFCENAKKYGITKNEIIEIIKGKKE